MATGVVGCTTSPEGASSTTLATTDTTMTTMPDGEKQARLSACSDAIVVAAEKIDWRTPEGAEQLRSEVETSGTGIAQHCGPLADPTSLGITDAELANHMIERLEPDLLFLMAQLTEDLLIGPTTVPS